MLLICIVVSSYKSGVYTVCYGLEAQFEREHEEEARHCSDEGALLRLVFS